MTKLTGVVCLVTGCTRGIGRGVAVTLGEQGATVYVTGRTLKAGEGSQPGRSLEELAAEIESKGGKAIPVVVDHADEKQATDLFDRIRREQQGRLDVLVNNAFAAAPFLFKYGHKKFFEVDHKPPSEVWDIVNNVGLRNIYICSSLAARMMIDYEKQLGSEQRSNRRTGLIINISYQGGKRYEFHSVYGVGKAAIDRMTRDMWIELRQAGINIAIMSLWPGLVRTEVIEEKRSEGILPPEIANIPSESPELTGRAIVALINEPLKASLARSGKIILVTDVATEYNLKEIDGSWPLNARSVQYILKSSGNPMGPYVPRFIRLTKSHYMSMLESADNSA